MSGPNIRTGIALGPRTTLGIGGEARAFAEIGEPDQLPAALDWADAQSLTPWVLAGGSNLLVSDAGFPGLVLQLTQRDLRFQDDGRYVRVHADAGLPWDDLVAACVAKDLGGIECLSGIPGHVGAAPIQNIGAYGQDVSETLIQVEAFNRETHRTEVLTNQQCEFSYRESLFKRNRDRYIVTGIVLRLKRGGPPSLGYRDLKARLAGLSPDLRTVRDTILQIRREKSMLLNDTDPNTRSAGSFFTNPIVSSQQANGLAEQAEKYSFGPMPQFPAPDDQVKLSAAWLIERAGFSKGYTQGRVGLSTKHCLALINLGEAKATDLVALAGTIRGGVLNTLGVKLVPEPVFVGFDASVDELLSLRVEE